MRDGRNEAGSEFCVLRAEFETNVTGERLKAEGP